MKKILLIIMALFIVISCKVSDLKLTAPTTSNIGISRVNFDHTLFLNSSCIQCHENKRPVTIPLHGNGNDCITCHTAVPNAQGLRTWKNLSSYSHIPAPQECISCHASKRPLAPTPHAGAWGQGNDCIMCHTPGSWTNATFTHKGKVLNTCTECHLQTRDSRTSGPLASLHPYKFYDALKNIYSDLETGSPRLATTPVPAPIPLLPDQSSFLNRLLNETLIKQTDQMECKLCHDNPDDNRKWYGTNQAAGLTDLRPTSMTFDYNRHKNRPSDTDPTSCSSCHEVLRPSNHTILPKVPGMSKGDCQSCHTYSKNAVGDGTAKEVDWKDLVVAFSHETQKPTTCIGCHSGSIPLNTRPLTATSNPTHPVIAGSYYKIDCVKCHTYETNLNPPLVQRLWSNITLDYRTHLKSTGGSPTSCVQCHKIDNDSLPNPALNPSHTKGAFLSNDCSTCHIFKNPIVVGTKWQQFTSPFSHSVVTSPTERCDGCHKTTVPTLTNMTTISSQNKLHVPFAAGTDCFTCHTKTDDWKNITYTHNVNDSCISCHSIANPANKTLPNVTQLPRNHFPIESMQCLTCHTSTAFTAWTGASFDHKNITSNACSTCHNNVNYALTVKQLPAVPTSHLTVPVGSECNSCHISKTSFKGMSLPTLNVTYGHLNGDLNCNSCHSGSVGYGKGKTIGHMATTNQCSTCHQDVSSTSALAINYKNFIIHSATATTNPAVLPAAVDTRCNICHNGASATGKATTAFAGHVAIGTSQCVACHSASLRTTPKYLNFTGAGFLHSATTTNCNSCHAGTGATGITTAAFVGHIPYTSTIQCSSCHAASMTPARNYNNFTLGVYTHAATDTCTTCHKNSAVTATQVSTTAVHTANSAMACNTCHSNTANFSAWPVHTTTTTTTDTTCNTCHTGTAGTYGKKTTAFAGHVAVGTSQCIACHSASLRTTPKYLNFTGGGFLHTTTNTSAFKTCNTCHAGAAPSGITMTAYAVHIATTAECVTCHAASITVARNYNNFSGGIYHHSATSVLRPSTVTINHSGEATCLNCHTTTVANSATNVKYSSLINAKTCAGCHMKAYIGQHDSRAAFGTTATTGTKVGTNYRNGDCISCHGDHGYEARPLFMPKLPILPGGI